MRGDYAGFYPSSETLTQEAVNISAEQAIAAWELIQACCGIDADEVGRMVGVR